MNENKNKPVRNNSLRYNFRMIAGFYLLYLTYKMIADIVNGVATAIKPVFGILIAVAFAAFGIFIIIDAYKKMKQEKKKQQEDAEAEKNRLLPIENKELDENIKCDEAKENTEEDKEE